MRNLFFGLLLVVSSVWADTQPFDCSKSPGRDLCLKTRKAESYIRECQGQSCYSMWRSYIVALDDLTQFYLSNFLPKDSFSSDIGEMAYSLSKGICGQEITGDSDWVRRVSLSENRALPFLKEVQERAGLPVVKTCKKEVIP